MKIDPRKQAFFTRVDRQIRPYWLWMQDRVAEVREQSEAEVTCMQDVADMCGWPSFTSAGRKTIPVAGIVWMMVQKSSPPCVNDPEVLEMTGADWWLSGWVACADSMIFAMRGWLAWSQLSQDERKAQ